MILAGLAALLCLACTQKTPQDRLTVNDKKIDKIIAQMTLEEKVEMLHSKTIMSSEGVPRRGIQDIKYADGPFGVREEVADGFRPKGVFRPLANQVKTKSKAQPMKTRSILPAAVAAFLVATTTDTLAYERGDVLLHRELHAGQEEQHEQRLQRAHHHAALRFHLFISLPAEYSALSRSTSIGSPDGSFTAMTATAGAASL